MFGRRNQERSFLSEELALLTGMSDYLIDIIDEDGLVRWMSMTQADLLGIADAESRELYVEAVYDAVSVERIRSVLLRNTEVGFSTTLELQMFGRAGRRIRAIARASIVSEGGRRALKLAKIELGPVGLQYDQIRTDAALMANILNSAKEAHWAIVFLEPVDTTQSREEIIRRVFENQSVWRMCNPAMARIYGLPEDIDINAQSVRLYWPRSPENEKFVGHIIDGNYSVDDAISVDRKHDGSTVYVSNDVRADIVDGYLTCLRGNIRNVTELSEARRKLGLDGTGE